MKERTIWEDTYFMSAEEIEDWKKTEYDFRKDEDGIIMTDDDLEQEIEECNSDYLQDERSNLGDIKYDQPIIVIADLGLWNGRHIAYKEIHSGAVSDCLYTDCDYPRWYVDTKGDFRAECIHHDGTNHYLYRVFKPEISEWGRIEFRTKCCNGTLTRADITKYTRRIGYDIADVYGWEHPTGKKAKTA